MTQFKMVTAGYEYRTSDDKIKIVKGWERRAVTHTGFCTLDRYKDFAYWTVYGLVENMIFTFNYLKDAKEFTARVLDGEDWQTAMKRK